MHNSLLGDLRVVELATMVFAPSTCVILADFGAEVIKVEPPGSGDLNRHYHQLSGMPESDLPYTFQIDNRNKQSVVLDLKNPAGLDAMQRLLRTADVFVTNYRIGALSRLGLDYENVKALNPNLIYALGTGYGEEGEESHKPGYDNVCYWSRSGIETHVFPHEGWLGGFPFGAGDHPSGMTLFAAIMLGLYRRQQTGAGGKVSTSLLANGAWANATLLQAQLCGARFRPRRPRAEAYTYRSLHYRSRDDRLMKLGIVNEDKDWLTFCEALERPDLAVDPRFVDIAVREANMVALIAEIDAVFASQDMAYWQQSFAEQDIPHAVLPSYQEAADDEQKAANGIVVPLQHPQAGDIRTVSNPITVKGIDKMTPTAAPVLGQHTRQVLSTLGYAPETLNQLARDGVIPEHC
ncbi:MAG: hypothetical protein RLZZ385_2149 [Pseudomonadota bacterium]|jgi:formyl-CoA transferase